MLKIVFYLCASDVHLMFLLHDLYEDNVKATDLRDPQVIKFMGELMSQLAFGDFNFANHCRARYGGSFGNYEAAYRLGFDLAQNEVYANKDWFTVEMYARREWKLKYPDKAWSEYKDAVKFAWQAVRGKMGKSEQ